MKLYSCFIVFTAFCLIPQVVIAQKVRIGFKAGPNLSLALYDDNFPGPDTLFEVDKGDYEQNLMMKPKFNLSVGILLDYDVSDNIFLSTGINLHGTRHGILTIERDLSSGEIEESQHNYHVFALKMPILFHYRLGKFISGAGVYGAWSFAGKLKSPAENRNLSFGDNKSSEDDFRRFDGGVQFEIAFGIKRWRIAAHYDLGLINLSHKTQVHITLSDNYNIYALKKHVIGLSFIYQPWPR